nr:phage protein Gp27 family protein [Petrachloros mirabilis]
MSETRRDELNQRLIVSGFTNYDELELWLRGLGHDISKSSIHRYAQRYEDAIAAASVTAQQLRSLVEAVGDDALSLGEGAYMLAINKAVEVLLSLNLEEQKISLTQLLKNIADLNKSAVPLKKYATETRERLAAKFAALEKEAETKTSKRTIDPETLRIIREEVYGLV